MTSQTDWQKTNDEYLAAAVAWLQLRLARLAPDHSPKDKRPLLIEIPLTSSPEVKQHRFFLWRCLRWLFMLSDVEESAADTSQALVLSGAGAATDEELANMTTTMVAAEQRDTPPALTILGQLFGLSRFERQVLLLCATRDLDTRLDER